MITLEGGDSMLVPIKDNKQQHKHERKYYTEKMVPYYSEQHHSSGQQPVDVFSQCEIVKSYDPQISSEEFIAKVPVMLAELTLQTNIKTIITFPEFVLEIKDVNKRLNITQCHLLLPTNKLFIKGFIREKILYARPNEKIVDKTKTSISSDLHSLTVDIPIQCITEIKKYISQPVIPEMNERHEFEFHNTKPLEASFSEKNQHMSSDLSRFHQESKQYYNELPYGELVSSKIIEWDEAVDGHPLPSGAPIEKEYFTKMEEKIVVLFTIKVQQNQQVCVTSLKLDHQ